MNFRVRCSYYNWTDLEFWLSLRKAKRVRKRVKTGPLGTLPQFGLFLSAALAVRYMALSDWPGFAEGGVLWFRDLTQPAVSRYLGTPMGLHGLILPSAIVLLTQLNIRMGFGPLWLPPRGT